MELIYYVWNVMCKENSQLPMGLDVHVSNQFINELKMLVAQGNTGAITFVVMGM